MKCIFKSILYLSVVVLLSSCGSSLECGEGTIERDNRCVALTQDEQLFLSIYTLALDSNQTELSYEEWIESIKGEDGIDGTNGTDGREIELDVENGYLVWRYVGEASWMQILNLSELRGVDGVDGVNGIDGNDGVDGVNGIDGIDGNDGKSIYDLYIESNPSYTGDVERFLNDLITNNLEETMTHTVTFDANNGSQNTTEEVKHNTLVTKPSDPVRDNYVFLGWEYNQQDWVFFGYSVYNDITLKASWIHETTITVTDFSPDPYNQGAYLFSIDVYDPSKTYNFLDIYFYREGELYGTLETIDEEHFRVYEIQSGYSYQIYIEYEVYYESIYVYDIFMFNYDN
jgi:hypothetical protein